MPAKKKPVKKATKKATTKKVAPKAVKKAPKKKPAALTPQLVWDPNTPREVEAAKEVHALFKQRRHEAFHVTAKGTKGDFMPKFDGAAGAMTFSPVLSRYERIGDQL